MRKQVLAAIAAAGAVAIPTAAASSNPALPVSGHTTLSSKQASNYFPVLTAHHLGALRRQRMRARRHVTVSPILQQIASCESGGNPRAIGGGGAFRGKYQFDYGSWASVGGHGDPAAAPESEQDMRAQMLLDRAGTSPWPVCG